MSFDLNSLKPVMADDGAVLQIAHPESEEIIENIELLFNFSWTLETQEQLYCMTVILDHLINSE